MREAKRVDLGHPKAISRLAYALGIHASPTSEVTQMVNTRWRKMVISRKAMLSPARGR